MPGHVCHGLAGAHFSVKRHPARAAGAPLATRAVRVLFLSMPGKREIEDVADIEKPIQKYLKQLAAAKSEAKKGMQNKIQNPTAQTPAAPEAETIASTGETSAAAGLGSAGDLAAAQGHACPPSRPAEGASTQDVATYFQTLAAWVHNADEAPGLRRADFAEKLPFQFKALPIQEQCGDEQSSSYKAPWNQGDAQIAMTTQREGEGRCGSRASQPQRGAASLCRLGSRFARFEVRAEYLQAEHFKQHAVSAVHRRAVMAWLNPDAPLRFAAQATLVDELLLCGAVPQPADWLRTWRACITPMSWQAAAKHLETEHYVHMLRARPVQPRALQHMARIQAEVVRASFREWVMEATSITLLFDDRH